MALIREPISFRHVDRHHSVRRRPAGFRLVLAARFDRGLGSTAGFARLLAAAFLAFGAGLLRRAPGATGRFFAADLLRAATRFGLA